MSFFYSLIGTIIYSYILTKIEIIILNIPIMFLGIVIILLCSFSLRKLREQREEIEIANESREGKI